MLNENLKRLRESRGFSQEELAARLHVVRQTVSKWEKARSVPDADMLARLGEILEVPVSALLGAEMDRESDTGGVAGQLAGINRQLAEKNRRGRRIWRAVAVLAAAAAAIAAILLVFSQAA